MDRLQGFIESVFKLGDTQPEPTQELLAVLGRFQEPDHPNQQAFFDLVTILVRLDNLDHEGTLDFLRRVDSVHRNIGRQTLQDLAATVGSLKLHIGYLIAALARFQPATNESLVETFTADSTEAAAAARRFLDGLRLYSHEDNTSAVSPIPPESRGDITASWKQWVVGRGMFDYILSQGEEKDADYERIFLESLNMDSLLFHFEHDLTARWVWKSSPSEFTSEERAQTTSNIRGLFNELKRMCDSSSS